VVATAAAAILVFTFSWLFRFNDPGGSFAGLTDDHFFYLVRAWQILFGDLPVRDYVDHGAPLYYYVGAAVQMLFGRGTLSEVAFAVTLLAASAALTFCLSVRASGSIVAGLVAAAFHALLAPRLYNYPKILVYAVAIPFLWWFADRPDARRRCWLAVITAVAFLFRHDHGVFVAIAVCVVLCGSVELSWRARTRHALLYVALTVALLAPYFVFIQLNRGLTPYFRDAWTWAARDRDRAPMVWPALFDSADPHQNIVAWTCYMELGLPFLAVAVLALSRAAFRPEWPRARLKLVTVAVLAAVLNAGFLRSPLEARLADPSVPHAIVIAWLVVAVWRLLARRESLDAPFRRHAALVRAAVCLAVAPFAFVVVSSMRADLYRRLESSVLVDGPQEALERVGEVRERLREEWRLESWQRRENRPDLINLALYLNTCTRPDDRVFMQHYAPQVLGLAQRAFGGGHADLRPGFFTTRDAQLLTIDRLRRQQVPVVLLETGEAYANFRSSFPLISAYLDDQYALAGTRVFDGRFGVQLFVRKDARPARRHELLGWPCFA
jgi:4-amino-4-deoxy-L-arabinose transferase-like glycosyltransferase